MCYDEVVEDQKLPWIQAHVDLARGNGQVSLYKEVRFLAQAGELGAA
jgi:hypothetical protein